MQGDLEFAPAPAPTAAAVPRLGSFVGGQWLASGREVPDLDPSRPQVAIAVALHADQGTVDAAVAAARRAAPEWGAAPSIARAETLRRAADILEARAADVARDLTAEEGKTIGESRGEVDRAVTILRYYAGQCLEPDGETYPNVRAGTWTFARRVPIGVVAVLTPWNFPIAIPAWKIAPALAYGNAVVWKPADLVPLTAVHLTRALAEAGLPQGVLNLLLGSGSEVGQALVEAPGIQAISFTGSNSVGRRIALTGAERGARVQLELGGKNPTVVLADADLDLAARGVANAAFLSAGQKCTATSRVIVEQAVAPAFADRLIDVVRRMPVGDPRDPATAIGPLASAAQLDRVRSYLEVARNDAARFLTGEPAPPPATGYFQTPVVVAGLPPASRIVREEVFGPVLALSEATDPADALRQANDTPFGLTACIYTRSLEEAARFVDGARVGVVKVNQETTGLDPHVPFGGMGESSSGPREQGKAAREFYTQWKSVYVAWT